MPSMVCKELSLKPFFYLEPSTHSIALNPQPQPLSSPKHEPSRSFPDLLDRADLQAAKLVDSESDPVFCDLQGLRFRVYGSSKVFMKRYLFRTIRESHKCPKAQPGLVELRNLGLGGFGVSGFLSCSHLKKDGPRTTKGSLNPKPKP